MPCQYTIDCMHAVLVYSQVICSVHTLTQLSNSNLICCVSHVPACMSHVPACMSHVPACMSHVPACMSHVLACSLDQSLHDYNYYTGYNYALIEDQRISTVW